MDYFTFQERFSTELDCINHFIGVRYGGGVSCPHCGSEKVYRNNVLPKKFQCNSCINSFSVFKDTIFEHSSTDMRKWMYAIHLFLNGKKGISAMQLQREIKVTYKTAWRMLKQIRSAMSNKDMSDYFEAVVEIDETYVGGKPRKGNKKGEIKSGRGTKKTPVVGIVDRDNKRVHARVAHPDRDGKKLTSRQLMNILTEVTKSGATVITDEFRGYTDVSKNGFIHLKVDHSREYVSGDIHTNNIECFWSTLKRGVYGIYHSVSVKYLQHYVDEFCFRYNNRRNAEVFDLVLAQSVRAAC